MRRIAFLTLGERGDFVIDDELAVEPLARRGVAVETIPWNQPDVDWARYALVVVRSTWDYQHHAAEFLATLERIEGVTRLCNSAAIARWNMRKTYLRELATQGVPTVPTLWRDGLARGGLLTLFDELGSDEVVIKPVMSGNAEGAWRLDRLRAKDLAGVIEAYFHGRPLMMQPFERAIVSEGEFSLIYMGGAYSHAILKVPKAGDFRVQEEHGSDVRSATPEPGLRATSDAAMNAVGERLIYGRADLVRHGEAFRVMELELVEPALYLRMDPGAPARFADAIAALFA
ncbi:MAG: ATP-grasp domain-containing protein [Gammaproteobacteria bacterium]